MNVTFHALGSFATAVVLSVRLAPCDNCFFLRSDLPLLAIGFVAGVEWDKTHHPTRDWKCARCAWDNNDDISICQICGTPAPSSTVTSTRSLFDPLDERDYLPTDFDLPRGEPGNSIEMPDFFGDLLEDLTEKIGEKAIDLISNKSKTARRCLKCDHLINEKARFCENCGADQEAAEFTPRKNRKTASVNAAKKARVKKSATEKTSSPRRKSQKPKDLPE